MKDTMTVLDTSRTTSLSTKYDTDPIVVMIQTKEIKYYVKQFYATTEHHQFLWYNMGAVLYSTIERIGRRSILLNTVVNI